MLYIVNIKNTESSQQCSMIGNHYWLSSYEFQPFTPMNIGTSSTDMTERPEVNEHFTCLPGRLSA